MQCNEAQFWTEAFKSLSGLIITKGDLGDLGSYLFSGFKWGNELTDQIGEEGRGTKISDVCIKIFGKFLDDKLRTNPRVDSGELAKDIGKALEKIKRPDIALELENLLEVRLIIPSVSRSWAAHMIIAHKSVGLVGFTNNHSPV